jgi:predicted DNA-binding protein (UPF0251 family)
MLEEVVMTLDEFEAIRLADLEGLYQKDAAQQMGISRTTFGRILDSGHRKVAEVLHGGKCLRLRSRPEVSETSRDRTGGESAVPEGRKSNEDLRTRRP